VSTVGTAISAAMLVYKLAPEMRDAIVTLVRALLEGDDATARRAYETARRVAFVARQRR
jgi:hypothetical protein